MVSDDGLFIKQLGSWLPYLTLLLSLFLYKRYKSYAFYKYFILYILIIVIVDVINAVFFTVNNLILFDIYTFFEFNSFALVYYHLLKDKTRLNILKALVLVFNVIYFIFYYFDFYTMYTVPIEGIVNSIIVILFFIELLNSENILNYKKLLSFWLSVAFLVFYLTTVPFWSLFYSSIFATRDMFYIIYYLASIFQIIFIYGLLACKKTEDLY
ncbi:MAG: hypothetical protein WAO74_08155 [Polaribacter sp.]|uniref:hypothetical protein n=1 Tax=Polaribacter sp. TaxID=1920175 RepID=UPI003BB17440